MNKFYRGEEFGFAYKATGIGWHKIPVLRNFPYLTGREIKIRLYLKSLYEDQEWLQGVLRYEPPIILHSGSSKEDEIKFEEYGDVFLLDESQYFQETNREYTKYKFEKGKWWSKTIAIKYGENFIHPHAFKCYLVLQDTSLDGKIIASRETFGTQIADIEIISDTKFWAWLITGIIALTAVVVGILNLISRLKN
ncbi:MAG: hypothetical protein ABSB40_12980 [Nitrososphaeria archaeon]|jgi:hypothetical protein